MGSKSIAIVVNYFPTISETFIVNQINSLIDLGFQVSLFAYNKVESSILHESFKKHGLLNKVNYFVKPPASKIQRALVLFKWTFQYFKQINWKSFFRTLNVFTYGKDAYTLKLFFEAQWFLVPYKVDIIHAHFGMVGNRIAYLKAKNILPDSIKLITTFHGYDLEPDNLLKYKISYKYLWNYANVFTVNTPYLEDLLKQVNLHDKPIYILPVGLDTTFFKRITTKKERDYFEIVFCGKLIVLKAPNLAIQIISELHKKDHKHVRLHIIGTGPMLASLERQVLALGLQNYVLFYGSQNQVAIKQYFEQSDVFLLPGIHDPETGRAETQGLVIQEAQAMELPVVVSDAGGMKYGLLPEVSGFVVNTGDLHGFVNVVEQLFLNPEVREKMGLNGRQFVIENYDNQILAKKLINIYMLA